MLQPDSELKTLVLFSKMNSHIHLQDSDCSGTSFTSELGAEQEFGGKSPGLDFEHGGFMDTLTSVSQVVNVGADLEGRTELDVHGGHEVLLLQQQQGLSVYLLGQELGGELLTAWNIKTGRNTGKENKKENKEKEEKSHEE